MKPSDVTQIIPVRLAATCHGAPERRAWLERLPNTIRELQDKWSLSSLEAPFDGDEVSCAWVAPAVRRDGSRAVLKLGMPHMEARDEIQALRFWDGEPTVRLLEADDDLNAMLLERCEPGAVLRHLPEPEQDVIIAGLLRRLWRRPAAPHPFRPLAAMTAHWADESLADAARWPDAGLVQAGLRLFAELSRPSPNDVLLATDLHAGNVLQAQREPWLVIDPKPFIGDPAYDATQHLFNCEGRVRAAPEETIRRFAGLLEVDSKRVRLWMFARAAAESRDSWDDDSIALARMLA
jgi:streptomycin 6-kinase